MKIYEYFSYRKHSKLLESANRSVYFMIFDILNAVTRKIIQKKSSWFFGHSTGIDHKTYILEATQLEEGLYNEKVHVRSCSIPLRAVRSVVENKSKFF